MVRLYVLTQIKLYMAIKYGINDPSLWNKSNILSHNIPLCPDLIALTQFP